MMKINGQKLKAVIDKSHKRASYISDKIGYGHGYISNCIYNNNISEEAVEKLQHKFHINPSDYVIEEGFEDYFYDEEPEIKKDNNSSSRNLPSKKDKKAKRKADFIDFLKNIEADIHKYIEGLEE